VRHLSRTTAEAKARALAASTSAAPQKPHDVRRQRFIALA
jgi:hypothetical protein